VIPGYLRNKDRAEFFKIMKMISGKIYIALCENCGYVSPFEMFNNKKNITTQCLYCKYVKILLKKE